MKARENEPGSSDRTDYLVGDAFQLEEKGFRFSAVEGDWPDCYRVNRYVKGRADSGTKGREVLHAFERWPTDLVRGRDDRDPDGAAAEGARVSGGRARGVLRGRAERAYCLEQGGDHAQAAHLTLLLDCAEICQTSANFMLRGSDEHKRTCAACAAVCHRGAEVCRRFTEDRTMQEYADACRRCADSCEQMAQ